MCCSIVWTSVPVTRYKTCSLVTKLIMSLDCLTTTVQNLLFFYVLFNLCSCWIRLKGRSRSLTATHWSHIRKNTGISLLITSVALLLEGKNHSIITHFAGDGSYDTTEAGPEGICLFFENEELCTSCDVTTRDRPIRLFRADTDHWKSSRLKADIWDGH